MGEGLKCRVFDSFAGDSLKYHEKNIINAHQTVRIVPSDQEQSGAIWPMGT